jgi:N-acetylmuramoyl-L-alanine amidase
MTMKADSKLVDALHPSPNTGERKKGSKPRLILLHYTGMPTAEKAIHWLAHPKSKVSCHYVIDDTGEITQMVPEGMRAWHAGVSHWAGETDINSASIGIEIQNPGHEHGYPDFPAEQMQAVAALCRDIAQRRAIRAESILAHSDVAPGRKIDPGEKFDWAWLAANGVGHWVEPAPPDSGSGRAYAVNDESGDIAEAQELLRRYGYNIDVNGRLDQWTLIVLRSFQLHFRPARADGKFDRATLDTLTRLVAALPVPALT